MQTETPDIDLVVVGSVALDTIATNAGRRDDILGGSVSYACAAASFFTRVGMVGVAGADFGDGNRSVYERFGIDTRGLQTAEGRTFRWSGVYEEDMNRRRTLATELNVFEKFSPEMPAEYRRAPFIFLANIAPRLQHHVLDQAEAPCFVAADTMDLWIDGDRDSLMELLPRVNLLLLNDEEALRLTGKKHLIEAARVINAWGAGHVLIKKGEHGAILAEDGGGLRLVPAFPVDDVRDPTGAGDCFAGALMGRLAAAGRAPNGEAFRDALLHAAVVASFCVEDFGLRRLIDIGADDIPARVSAFRRMIV